MNLSPWLHLSKSNIFVYTGIFKKAGTSGIRRKPAARILVLDGQSRGLLVIMRTSADYYGAMDADL